MSGFTRAPLSSLLDLAWRTAFRVGFPLARIGGDFAGDIAVMDNPGSHKGQAVRQLIRSASAKLFFLPRYSPDLNPIEQVLAKLKTLLRKTDPRSTEATWRGIGTLLDHFKPEECANYLANAGYASA